MAYSDRFVATDNLISHLKSAVSAITDAAVLAYYTGFLSVSAVTVYELAIKDIFCDFASKRHTAFGSFVENHFRRINGRIKIETLKDEHLKLFGDTYSKEFQKLLCKEESSNLKARQISIKSSYQNLIQCRHDFVHKGFPTLTFNEVIEDYKNSKEVIHCLNDTMKI
jgi:hypothetical protein